MDYLKGKWRGKSSDIFYCVRHKAELVEVQNASNVPCSNTVFEKMTQKVPRAILVILDTKAD